MRASLICVVLASATARADDLADARKLEATLEYDRALVIVDAAIARGGAEPVYLSELHMLAGELTAGLDRAPDAEDHFARALALRSSVALPTGTSPKLTAPFEAARARGPALRVHAAATRGAISLVVEADPLGLAAGVAVRIAEASGQHGEVIARTSRTVAIPPGAVAIEVAALDTHGNRVWVGAAPAELLPPPPPPRDAPRLFARPIPWAVATALLAVAGGAFAWQRSSLQSDWNALRAQDGADYAHLTAIESRGKDYAIAADVAFGLTAVAAVATIVLYARAPASSHATLVVAPGAIGLARRF